MKLTISFAVLCLAYTISTFKGPDVADAKPLVPKSQRSSTDMKRSEGSSESSSEDSSGFDRCSTDPCMNMGTCFDGTDNYRCICTDGFKGQNCEEFDSCSTDPCQNNGTCIDGADNYTCICADGFKGPSCEDSEPCQPGLVFILDSCYYFSQTDATWYDAREACIGLGGYLVAMETDDEYLSLTKYAQNGWTGLNDLEREGFFYWTYTGEYFIYNIGSISEHDCIYLHQTGLFEQDCSSSLPYICEID